jgi:hypothetical protein
MKIIFTDVIGDEFFSIIIAFFSADFACHRKNVLVL